MRPLCVCMRNLEILYKDKNCIIINKPQGMPSQKDLSGDTDAMAALSEQLSASGENSDLWLVHRLDRGVGGLLAYARNKSAAAAMSELVSSDGMEKYYVAVCHGECKSGEYRDYLFKDSVAKKAFVVKSLRRGSKEAVLEAEVIKYLESEDVSLALVKLKTGRFHQIRAQFSARGNSLLGDKKYGSHSGELRSPALFCSKLAFSLFGKRIEAALIPSDEEYPWSLFGAELNSVKEKIIGDFGNE